MREMTIMQVKNWKKDCRPENAEHVLKFLQITRSKKIATFISSSGSGRSSIFESILETLSNNMKCEILELIRTILEVLIGSAKTTRKTVEAEHQKRQPSQNAGIPSNAQLPFSDAFEKEDFSFGQDIQRYQQFLTERTSQVSLF
ncbi:unnamed protein product [Caenorhabditis angaria]|uniref:Tyrosine-protein phosphatase domain-containing protein n=1 Tax=Caenorhabditis angaria TaxID=860376 RepID=A0A9P1I657_9PELO|nr:unnamed protein product [Caenorhabditis angaria]